MEGRHPDELRRVHALRFNCEADRWELHGHGYHIKIKYAWNGETWCEYRYFVMYDGHELEAITFAKYKERIQAILDNEGDESADLWVDSQRQVMHVRDDHHVFKLAQYWEAMLALGLFRPMVTHKEWEGILLDEELRLKMDAARDRHMEKERGGDPTGDEPADAAG